MFNFFISLIISIITSFGIAIIIVEKSDDYPVRRIRIILQFLLKKVYWKLPRMLFCSTCTSVWAALIVDTCLCFINYLNGSWYFFWPFSGCVAGGFTWTIIEFLNAIDKQSNINIFPEENNDN